MVTDPSPKKNSIRPTLPLVLVVDDVAENIRLIANILSNQVDCNLAFAKDGVGALETVKRRKPDLILLDVMMPGDDGFTVCQKLKANSDTKDIPVIFLTAKVEEEDVAKGFDVGAVDYILKPIRAKELLARVRTQLAIRENSIVLNDRMMQLRNLVRIVCHDVANPVSGAMGYLDILREIHRSGEETDCSRVIDEEAVDVMSSSLGHTLEIIGYVRNSLAMEEGKISMKLVPCNLKELVEEALLLLRSKIQGKEMVVNVDVESGLQVNVDKITFTNSVLCNLLTNAIKFSMRGGNIDISAKMIDGEICFCVQDYGIGIPQSILGGLFELSSTTSRLGTEGEEGTGYGMPLMKQFVEACEGRINIDSREALGDENGNTRICIFIKPV